MPARKRTDAKCQKRARSQTLQCCGSVSFGPSEAALRLGRLVRDASNQRKGWPLADGVSGPAKTRRFSYPQIAQILTDSQKSICANLC